MSDYEDSVLSNGWSITVGQLREALEGVPDDYEVMLENADVEDIDIAEVRLGRLYPPSATGSVGLFIISGGQTVNAEYDYDNRMDAHHAMGGASYWNEVVGRWVSE